jgi:hypothetical protein
MSGIAPDELCSRWRTLSVRKFASLQPISEYLHATNMAALGDADGMVQYVYPTLGVEISKINAALGIDATFNVCRFDDKTVVPLPHPQLDLPRLVAAASLPIFLPAVQAEGSTWTDAAWIKDSNLLSCVERGARELWLIWCIGNTTVYRNGAFNQYVHMIEMSAIGALNWELAAIADINARIARGDAVWGHKEPIVLHVIKPEVPLPLDPDFYLGRIDAATLIDMGYRDARRGLRLRQPTPFDPRATQMREPGTGVSFRETMAGGFTLGVAEPRAGARTTTLLTMHATIHIEDIGSFVADPQHKAELTGHIDFVPFGRDIPAESGVFGLFTPSGDPALRYMVYELGFRHSGKSYYLAGKKRVRLGGFWKLWGETTTLYSTLHEGIDTNGPVVGSGILRLGMMELMKLLTTTHAINAATKRQSAGALWQFFKFFAAKLMRTYVLRRPD